MATEMKRTTRNGVLRVEIAEAIDGEFPCEFEDDPELPELPELPDGPLFHPVRSSNSYGHWPPVCWWAGYP